MNFDLNILKKDAKRWEAIADNLRTAIDQEYKYISDTEILIGSKSINYGFNDCTCCKEYVDCTKCPVYVLNPVSKACISVDEPWRVFHIYAVSNKIVDDMLYKLALRVRRMFYDRYKVILGIQKGDKVLKND